MARVGYDDSERFLNPHVSDSQPHAVVFALSAYLTFLTTAISLHLRGTSSIPFRVGFAPLSFLERRSTAFHLATVVDRQLIHSQHCACQALHICTMGHQSGPSRFRSELLVNGESCGGIDRAGVTGAKLGIYMR